MQGVPASTSDATFDSYLLLKKNGVDNHTLTLVLKIFLNPMTTFGLPRFPFADADGKWFWIIPWRAPEWSTFQRTFKQQCLRWNDRFWLTPPAGFSKLDVKLGSRTVRPNIYCHLYIDLIGTMAGAHRAINVVNLDKRRLAARLGVRPGDLDSGDFRSDWDTYDSLDVVPRTTNSTDDKGITHRHVNYLTVVHEIGHALGLDHIGVAHKDPLCRAAIFIDENLPSVPFLSAPALLADGSNSRACYGDGAPPSRGANVMGGGTQFDETNASPWADRLAVHTGAKAEDWKVSLRRVPPKLV
jgi:hypothetical protein